MAARPRILVTHPEKNLCELLKLHLVCAGYDVVLAEDPVEAGRELLRRRPDLIVLDVHIPYLDGFEFVSALKAEPSTALIPVVFLAATQPEAERALRVGAAACLTAPLYADSFLAVVQRCLRGEHRSPVTAGIRAQGLTQAA